MTRMPPKKILDMPARAIHPSWRNYQRTLQALHEKRRRRLEALTWGIAFVLCAVVGVMAGYLVGR